MAEIFLIASMVFYLFLLVTMIYLLLDNREPTSTIAWILVFLFLPLVGFVVYFFAGRNWRKKKKASQLKYHLLESRLQHLLSPLVKEHKSVYKKRLAKAGHPKYKNELIQLLYQSSGALLTTQNQVAFYFDGASKFKDLFTDLEKARHYIYIEYFIWRNDALTERIKDILIAKANEGIDVKILTDSLGSIFLKSSYIKALRQAGVKIFKYYNFMSLLKFHTINYRNHRKMVIVDGSIGYTGGMNMGSEYIDGGKRFDHWRDTHLKVTGRSVKVLEAVFAIDWYNTTNEKLIFKQVSLPSVPKRDVPVQLTTSGPDSSWPSIKQLYFFMINAAQKNLYIQTPYFIPDPSILTALKTAGLRGLDVRLMVTGIPDKKLPYWSAFTYFEGLLEAGIKIYHYNRGFLHSKVIAIDSECCSVGTANMDMRSFRLNYELNTLIYDRQKTKLLEKQYLKDLRYCKRFTMEDYEQLSWVRKLAHSIARLFAPLL